MCYKQNTTTVTINTNETMLKQNDKFVFYFNLSPTFKINLNYFLMEKFKYSDYSCQHSSE